MRHMFTGHDLPFDRAFHVGMDVWAVYANEAHVIGAVGTPLLCKGTKTQVLRQVDTWIRNPDEFYALAFTWRQAHMQERRMRMVA
jgi:hypothetical protein